MEKYYDLSKMTSKEIVEDFLAAEEAEKKAQEEAVEQAVAEAAEAEEESWECVGVYDADWFVNGGKDEVFAQLAADME